MLVNLRDDILNTVHNCHNIIIIIIIIIMYLT